MADSSRNPGDIERLGRLERALLQEQSRLAALRAEAQEAIAAQKQAADRLGKESEAVRQERRQGEAARRRRPAGEPAPGTPEEARLTSDTARQEERKASAVQKTRDARRESLRLAEQEQRLLDRGPIRPTFGGGAFNRFGGRGGVPSIQYGEPLGPYPGRVLGGGPPALPPGTRPIAYLPPGRQFNLGPASRGPYGFSATGYASEQAAQAQQTARRMGQTLREAAGFTRIAGSATAAATQQEVRFTQALRDSGAALGINAQQMQRHGALTTEFIAAAARGEVTMRDLGSQVGLTIGKFAGWTLAATAVYGAVGALGAVGRGAIDAASGVDLVARILPQAAQNADGLQERFAELSHQFNLPIADVTQAVYGMGKVFGTQGGLTSALKASEQALFAVKVGELDAATATRYLTGIVSGFQLSANELPAVFDAINQAQNRFGGNTGQLIAGVSKAAGGARLAGLQWRDLIALIQAATRLTGTTGENVGTAIGRSASVVLTPQGQTRLRAAGLNPQQPYMDLLNQAFKLSQGQSRERVQEIARALVPSGGQFARVFVPLLQNKQLVDRIRGEITPENAAGSASRELARALRQPNEQLKQLVTNLEQLGVQLSRAGALDPFLALVRGLNASIHGLERLLALFNNMTAALGPLRHVVVSMLELAAVMRVMRRFDLGALLPGAIGRSLSASPGQRLRRDSQIQLDEQRAAMQQLRNSVAGQGFRAQYAAAVAPAGSDEHTAALRKSARLERELAAIDAEIVGIDENRAVVNKQIRGAVARDLGATRAILDQHRIPYSSAYAAPGARRFQEQTPTVQGARFGAPVSILGARSGFQQFQQSLALRAQEAQTLSRLGIRTSLTARATGTAFGLAAGTLRLTGSALAGVAGSMRGFAAAAAAAVGPLDVIVATAFIVPSILSHYNQKLDEFDRLSRSDFGGDPDAIRVKAQQLRQRSTFQRFIDTEQRGFEKLGNFLSPGDPFYAPGRQQDALAKDLESKAREIERLQSHGQYLRLDQVRERLGAALKRSIGDPVGEAKAIQKAIRQTQESRALTSSTATDEQRATARQYLAGLRDRFAIAVSLRSDVDTVLAQINSATELGTYIDERGAHLAGAQSQAKDRRALGLAIVRARSQVADGTSTLKDALTNIDRANTDVQQSVQQDLTSGLRSAGSAAAQGRVRGAAIEQLRRALVTPIQERIRHFRELAVEQDRAVQGLETQVIDTSQDTSVARSENTQGAAAARLASLKRQRDALIKRRNSNREKLRQLRAQIKIEEQIVSDFAADQQRQQFQGELEEFDAGTAVQQSRTGDPVEQARILARRLHERTEKVREGYRRHLQSLADVLNAEARENEAMRQLSSQQFQDFQGRQQLGAAQFELAHVGDQRAILKFAIQQAQQGVAEARKRGLTPAEIRQAKEQVLRAQVAFAEYVQQQAAALADAQLNLALSKTDDPVKQAQLRLAAAVKALGRAKTPADRINAQAEINNRRRDLRNTRYQDQFDTIEFEAEMGRITRETEISRLTSLLKIVKGNRDFRRQIQLRIHALKQEADQNQVELNVGDIRLPTLYDVRRLAKMGTQSALNLRQNFVINVDGSGDPSVVADHVFSRFAQESTGGMRSAVRAQGG